MIAPQASAAFVAAMERVLDIYSRPYDSRNPVVCMDETPRQLIRETRQPIAAVPGRPERHDYEYERCGVCNVFMASEPLAGRRLTKVTARSPSGAPSWTGRCLCKTSRQTTQMPSASRW